MIWSWSRDTFIWSRWLRLNISREIQKIPGWELQWVEKIPRQSPAGQELFGDNSVGTGDTSTAPSEPLFPAGILLELE